MEENFTANSDIERRGAEGTISVKVREKLQSMELECERKTKSEPDRTKGQQNTESLIVSCGSGAETAMENVNGGSSTTENTEKEISDRQGENIEVELPHFVPEGKLLDVEEKIDFLMRSGVRKFRVSDPFYLSIFTRGGAEELELTAGYPLPVSNSLAAKELKRFGLVKTQAWIELEQKAVEDLVRRNPIETEIYRYGRPFILATRARIEMRGRIDDPRGKQFYIAADKEGELTYLYPREMINLPHIPGCDAFYDYRLADQFEVKRESTFNFYTELV